MIDELHHICSVLMNAVRYTFLPTQVSDRQRLTCSGGWHRCEISFVLLTGLIRGRKKHHELDQSSPIVNANPP